MEGHRFGGHKLGVISLESHKFGVICLESRKFRVISLEGHKFGGHRSGGHNFMFASVDRKYADLGYACYWQTNPFLHPRPTLGSTSVLIVTVLWEVTQTKTKTKNKSIVSEWKNHRKVSSRCSVPQLNTLRVTQYVDPHPYLKKYRYAA